MRIHPRGLVGASSSVRACVRVAAAVLAWLDIPILPCLLPLNPDSTVFL